MVAQAVQVSILAMGVIFTVLTILIGVIQVLVKFIPYQEPPAKAPTASSRTTAGGAGSEEESEVLAAIHVAVAHHRGESPQSIQITNVQSQ
ncbi:MAG: OadG family protein [Candidatus Nitronauta litoralis]|uniref:OadG family protein n=1 Tax=Candidatus Nitronauta litoralis TaxID=2705533 RepID=A0A7T0FZP1_9BACT|nr:MAG: OadG family protein [Candidatus Nitronauta litoralis]